MTHRRHPRLRRARRSSSGVGTRCSRQINSAKKTDEAHVAPHPRGPRAALHRAHGHRGAHRRRRRDRPRARHPEGPTPSARDAASPRTRALELEGRDVYVREGCYTCHSQMIRPFRWETQRYGEPSDPRRLALRPPVPVGLEAHRSGPRPRGQQVPEPLALPAHDRSARDHAGLEHAVLRAPRDREGRLRETPDKLARCETRRALHRRRRRRAPTTTRSAQAARASPSDLAARSRHDRRPDSEMVALIAYLQRLGKDKAAHPSAARASREREPAAERARSA